jgi:hypothetical protein
MRSLRIGVIVLATLLGACSVGRSGSSSISPPAADLCFSADPSCSLKASTYSPTVFRPAIRFVFDAGWSKELQVVDCITLFRKEMEKLFFVSGVADLGTKPDDLIRVRQ